MRTSTFKRIGLVVLLVALGLTLVGCGPDKAFFAEADGLKISAQGRSDTRTTVTIKTDHETLVFTMLNNDTAHWFYDVSPDQREYVIVHFAGDGSLRQVDIHKWTTTKPADFGK